MARKMAKADNPKELQRVLDMGFEKAVADAKRKLKGQLRGKKYVRGTNLSWAKGRIPEKHRGMLWKVWTGFARETPGGLTRKDLVAGKKGGEIRILRWSRYQQGLKAYQAMKQDKDAMQRWEKNKQNKSGSKAKSKR